MSRKKKTLSESQIKDLISFCLADEILHRIPVTELTPKKMQEVRIYSQEYLVRQGAHSLDTEEAVRVLLPGLIAELGVETSAAPLYLSFHHLP